VVDGQPLLLFEELGTAFREKTALLQHARQHVLTHQRLLKEIEQKDVLLHCIIHDLRSPMVSAHSAFQLLAAEKLTAKSKSTLEIGLTELERQNRLLESILGVFAAETGTASDPTPTTVDVVACARDVVEAMGPAFALKGVGLLVDAAHHESGPWLVAADRDRLIRVFANLADNALRHSDRGSTVYVRFARRPNHVEAVVEDEGPGVPRDLAAQLFDRFVQGGRRPGRAGLGLHFCRITVEGWGGSIGHRNRREGGATFWFRLPLARTGEPGDPAPGAAEP
jgi:signal transduction histidine kinase